MTVCRDRQVLIHSIQHTMHECLRENMVDDAVSWGTAKV